MRRRTMSTLVLLVTATLVVAGPARADGCADPSHPGGDWPSYGHDLANTRTQDQENVIDATNAGQLAAAWNFNVADDGGGTGQIQSTPVVAEGCMYVTTTTGWIFALNADDGSIAWAREYAATGSFGGMWSPAVLDGVLYVTVSNNGAPYVIALDALSGELIWDSEPVSEAGVFSNAGAVVFDGLYFMGTSDGEGGHSRAGGWAIFDLADGSLLHREFTVPQADFDLGYSGGSVWATSAVDTEGKYLYTGTGQPSNTVHPYEHRFTNAIVKIDVARARDANGIPVDSAEVTNPKFGKIVDAYKGNTEYAHAPLDNTTSCQATMMADLTAGCIKEDVDFGSSPNLFTDSQGNLLVGEYQKTGIYHAAFADTMTRAWTATMSQMIGPPYLANAAASAFDGEQIINVGSFPGQMVAVERDFGAYNWIAPVLDGTNYNPTETANGVAYINDAKGWLHAYDTTNGLPVLAHPMALDTDGGCGPSLTSSGSAIARNTVYAACGEWVIAYRLP